MDRHRTANILIIMSQRKQNLKGKEFSGTPTKVAHPSPSRQPARSPLTASKFNASNSKPNVSYGELQIVLENIQEIRRKANQQISALTADNQRLREELNRSQQDFEELTGRLNRSNSKNDFEIKVIEQLEAAEDSKKALEAEIKERTRAEVALEGRNAELQRALSERQQNISDLEQQVDVWSGKWKWAFQILAGDAERSQELIWKVKNQYSNGIWSIIEDNTIINQQLQLKTGKLEVLERELSEIKLTSKQTTSLLERSMAEITTLNLKLSHYEQELTVLREKYMMTENELSSNAKDQKLRQAEYENAIAALESKLVDAGKQKQLGIRDFISKTARLEEQIHQREQQQLEKQKHEQYQALISQICEQSQDYSQLLERMRYLEKFKAEHYFNVEKIQYLCKMLDY